MGGRSPISGRRPADAARPVAQLQPAHRVIDGAHPSGDTAEAVYHSQPRPDRLPTADGGRSCDPRLVDGRLRGALQASSQADRRLAPIVTSPAQDPKVIVIIDDNEQIRTLVRRALQ